MVAPARLLVSPEPPNVLDESLVGRARQAARVGALSLMALGTIVLIGWAFDISLLTGLHSSLATMKANTAALFFLLGAALWLARDRPSRPALIIVFVIVGVSMLTLAEYGFGVNLGIDQALFADTANAAQTSHAGRMAPAAAVAFILLASALLVLDRPAHARIANVGIVIAAVIAFLSLCGHIYGVVPLYRIGSYTAIALHTAVGLFIASATLVAMRPRRGIMSVIVGMTAGGATIRRLLPVIVLAPLALGWLLLQGQEAGLYDTVFGVAILTTGNIALFAVTAVRLGVSLHQTDLLRTVAESESATVRRDLAITLDSIADAVIATDSEGRIARMNPVAEAVTGWTAADAVGKPIAAVFRATRENESGAIASSVLQVLADGQPVRPSEPALHMPRTGPEVPIAHGATPILDEDGSLRGVAVVFRDVSAELASQHALRNNEELYRDLFENAPDMLVSADIVTRRIVLCNETLATRTGFSKAEIIGRQIDDLYTPRSRATMNREQQRFERDGELRDVDRELICKDGSVVEVGMTLKGLRDPSGALVGGRAIFHEIGDRKQAERDRLFLLEVSDLAGTAADSDALLRAVCERLGRYLEGVRCFVMEIDQAAGMAISRFDSRGSQFADAYPLSVFGAATRGDLEQRRVVVNHNAGTDPRTAPIQDAYRTIGIGATIAVPLFRDGRLALILAVSTPGPRTWSSREVILVRSAAERTWLWFERQRIEESLRAREADLHILNSELEARVTARTAALSSIAKEREVLLQEVHHRVKNNLQVVSSLINMQMRQVSDKAAASALAECRARIETIGLIHASLYQTNDYARVPFSEYARDLVSNLLHVTGASSGLVDVEVDLDTVALPVDRAIPCGLILNELITNAIKHAFGDGQSGTIHISLKRATDGAIVLTVRDDGIGLPTNFSLSRLESMGMQLVATLVDQLDGTLEIIRAGGTAFVITFRVVEEA